MIPQFSYAQSDPTLPGWFKSVAQWWKEGLISDKEVLDNINTLVDLDVIILGNIEKKVSDSSSIKSSKERIPSYVKDVFGFWSDDLVSDAEIGNQLKYMVEQGMITSKKLDEKREAAQIDPPSLQLDSGPADLDPELIKRLYVFNKWNELTATWLLETKNVEAKILNDLVDQTWDEYSKNKNAKCCFGTTHWQLYSGNKKKNGRTYCKELEACIVWKKTNLFCLKFDSHAIFRKQVTVEFFSIRF